MNLQLKDLARASPSVVDARAVSEWGLYGRHWLVILTMSVNLALALKIALVADDDHGEVILVLDSQDLLLECGDFFKALAGGDGVDEQETLACAHILLSHGTVLFLASGIEDIEKGDLIVNDTLLTVGI